VRDDIRTRQELFGHVAAALCVHARPEPQTAYEILNAYLDVRASFPRHVLFEELPPMLPFVLSLADDQGAAAESIVMHIREARRTWG
jgi:hypothetical protein